MQAPYGRGADDAAAAAPAATLWAALSAAGVRVAVDVAALPPALRGLFDKARPGAGAFGETSGGPAAEGIQWLFDAARGENAGDRAGDRAGAGEADAGGAGHGLRGGGAGHGLKGGAGRAGHGFIGGASFAGPGAGPSFAGSDFTGPGFAGAGPGPGFAGAAVDPWDFSAPEDNSDDPLVFTQFEAVLRGTPAYGLVASTAADLCDLHISIPFFVPGGTVVVADPTGPNWYDFGAGAPGASAGAPEVPGKAPGRKAEAQLPVPPHLAGARFLFGGPGAGPPGAGAPAAAAGVAGNANLAGNLAGNIAGNAAGGGAAAASTFLSLPSICDIWASFLSIRLGSLYNLPPPLVSRVSRVFVDSLAESTRFFVPLSLDCRGVTTAPGGGAATLARPATKNDLKRLRKLRRDVQRFALRLVAELGFNRGGAGAPRVELGENCSAAAATGRKPIVIAVRDWGPLREPATRRFLRDAAAGRGATPAARVAAGEIRLEHDCLRMVDCRWKKELVPGRRVAGADGNAGGGAAGRAGAAAACAAASAATASAAALYAHPSPLARVEFCRRLPPPLVKYAYCAAAGGDPRPQARKCKLGAHYRAYLARWPDAGPPPAPAKSPRPPPRAADGGSAPDGAAAKGGAGAADGGKTGEVGAAGSAATAPAAPMPTNAAALAAQANAAALAAPAAAAAAAGGGAGADFGRSGAPGTFTAATTTGDDENAPPEPASAAASAGAGRRRQPSLDAAAKTEPRPPAPAPAAAGAHALGFPAFPLKKELCKYFQNDGCARGVECHFLHPADRLLETDVDVRTVPPNADPQFNP